MTAMEKILADVGQGLRLEKRGMVWEVVIGGRGGPGEERRVVMFRSMCKRFCQEWAKENFAGKDEEG